MDSNEYPSVPNLAQMHVRLATDCRRVEAVVDSQSASMEQLLTAASNEDWEKVVQASRHLANLRTDQVDVEVIRTARELCREFEQSSVNGKKPMYLARLLAACRATRQCQT